MSSNLRIGGLASGMDIDQMVSDLMKVQRMRLDKIKQDKQIAEWQRDDFREIKNALKTFKDKTFDMKLQTTYMTKKASSSNEGAVTASASASASNGVYHVHIDQLAAGVNKGSQAEFALSVKKDDGTNRTLNEQFGAPGFDLGGADHTISFKLAGSKGEQTFTFDTNTKTINDVVSEINKAKIGITASYDDTLKRFYLSTDSTGASAKIHVMEDAEGFLSDAGGTGANTLKLQLDTGNLRASDQGKNAIVDFGDTNNLEFSTNTFIVNGITVTAKQQGADADITVATDTDKIYESIKGFVDLYNTTIEKINNELGEKRYRDYRPLTDEQREELSDDQIEKWEEKARSGLLKSDFLLANTVSKMRGILSTSVVSVRSADESVATATGTSTASAGATTLTINQLATAAKMEGTFAFNGGTTASDNLNASLPGTLLPGTLYFKVNGSQLITIDTATDSIDTLVDKINNAGGGVTASFDSGANKLSIVSSTTGSGSKVEIKVYDATGTVESATDDTNLFKTLNLTGALFDNAIPTYDAGVDASYTITENGGTPTDYTSSSNSVSNNGINYTLNKVGTTIFGVTKTSLSAIGIKPGAAAVEGGKIYSPYEENGKLYVSEAALKKAINDDPEAVMDLFTKSSDIDDEKGFAVRLYDSLTASVNSLIGKAGADLGSSDYDPSILGKRIDNYNKDIYKWEDRLKEMEDRYWRQFSAMESALNKMNSQSAWLAQQFGGGS